MGGQLVAEWRSQSRSGFAVTMASFPPNSARCRRYRATAGAKRRWLFGQAPTKSRRSDVIHSKDVVKQGMRELVLGTDAPDGIRTVMITGHPLTAKAIRIEGRKSTNFLAEALRGQEMLIKREQQGRVAWWR